MSKICTNTTCTFHNKREFPDTLSTCNACGNPLSTKPLGGVETLLNSLKTLFQSLKSNPKPIVIGLGVIVLLGVIYGIYRFTTKPVTIKNTSNTVVATPPPPKADIENVLEKINTEKWETKDVIINNAYNKNANERNIGLVKDLTNMLDEIKDLPKGASMRNFIIKYCPLNPRDTVIIRKPNGSSERTSFSTYADTLSLKARPFKCSIDSVVADTSGYQNYFLSKLEIIQTK